MTYNSMQWEGGGSHAAHNSALIEAVYPLIIQVHIHSLLANKQTLSCNRPRTMQQSRVNGKSDQVHEGEAHGKYFLAKEGIAQIRVNTLRSDCPDYRRSQHNTILKSSCV